LNQYAIFMCRGAKHKERTSAMQVKSNVTMKAGCIRAFLMFSETGLRGAKE
jgi:hypothetical protein